ncbi:uncharacterized protein LOC125645736 [Ostrea edulis]|uniref:uncharacterized protein LOC125645736 n=1 Tax=Ostrea edulis TaxID=37623 RepID=UPI002094228B|nr:uncharacterized protein LOC125645736 [Ostrea edulis]XP_055998268.1 uncharacterized protein LOC125645736 [Ostrea edulis]
MDVSKVLLVALILVICAVIFQLIGLASPYWVTADTATTKTNSGLWRTCTEGVQTGLTTCVDTKDIFLDNDWLEAAQAMGILAFLALLVAVVTTILKLFVMKDKKPLLFAAIGSSFAGALFILISISVYADNLNDMFSSRSFDYAFAFVFSILGMIVAIGAGVAMLVELLKK